MPISISSQAVSLTGSCICGSCFVSSSFREGWWPWSQKKWTMAFRMAVRLMPAKKHSVAYLMASLSLYPWSVKSSTDLIRKISPKDTYLAIGLRQGGRAQREVRVHHDAGRRSESDSEDTFVCQSRAKRQRGTDEGGESRGDDQSKRQRHVRASLETLYIHRLPIFRGVSRSTIFFCVSNRGRTFRGKAAVNSFDRKRQQQRTAMNGGPSKWWW